MYRCIDEVFQAMENMKCILFRRKSFATLGEKKKTVLSMPQSLHFNNKTLEQEDAENMMQLLTDSNTQNLKKQIILTWRQENSYQRAKELYPLVDNRYREKL